MGLPALRALLVCVLVAGAAAGTLPSEPRLASDDSPATVGGFPADGLVPDSPADGLAVEGDPGGVDPRQAYSRLGTLYDRDLPAATTTFRQAGGVDLRETHPDPLFGLLAGSAVRIDRPVRGAASEGRASVSYRSDAPPAFVERVFVHELAHAFEPPSLDAELESAAGAYADTTDAALARQAVAEGAATFVADVYAERYLGLSQSAWLGLAWPTMTDATRLLWAPYRYGADHVRARASSPAHLDPVYADPPLTTEAVLHPLRTGTERRPLAVDSAASVAGFERAATDAKGELYLRVLLGSELPPDRAARAAAGWGNDRLVTYSGADASFAWVLRWDTPRDARQFEAAMADYLNATATRRGAGWTDGEAALRLDCVSGETCYLLAGDSGFVRTAGVAGNGSEVVVS